MVAPLVYAAGSLAVRFLPALARGALWVVKQPFTNTIRTGVAVGGAHYLTDGISTRAGLTALDAAGNGIAHVVGKDTAISAGQTALDASGKVALGLGGAAAETVSHYGGKAVSEVAHALPLGKLGATGRAISEGVQQRYGDITAPDSIRPSNAFGKLNDLKETAEDALEENEGSILGMKFNKAAMTGLYGMAKSDAMHNPFIQFGMALGAVSGGMSTEGALKRSMKATAGALTFAFIFGAIGYLFGQRSAFIDHIMPKLKDGLAPVFGYAAQGEPAPAAVQSTPAPALKPRDADQRYTFKLLQEPAPGIA